MPSVFIKTYGCQMNERDSEAVAAQLVAKGYSLAPSEAAADVVLLNTCSVRDNAEQKAISKMENLAGQFRKQRPGVILGFLGCMAQSRGKELIDQLPDVDLVVGTQKFHRVADYVDDLLAGRRTKVVDIEEERGSEATIKEHLLSGTAKARSVTAFVSIMQGCNQYCTFCIVPYTRGQERSRTIVDIVAECRELVARGVKKSPCSARSSPATGGEMGKVGRAPEPGHTHFLTLPLSHLLSAPSSSSSMRSTPSRALSASASHHPTRRATAPTSSPPTRACPSSSRARTCPCSPAATGCSSSCTAVTRAPASSKSSVSSAP